MEAHQLNAVRREIRDNENVHSSRARAFGEGTYETAASIALEIVCDSIPDTVKELFNYNTAKLYRCDPCGDGRLKVVVFHTKL